MFLLFNFTINDDDAFLENIFCIIGRAAISDYQVMNGRVIVFVDILQYAVISGLYPLYNFLNRKFTHNIACSGVLRHKTKKKTLTAWRSKDIFAVMGSPGCSSGAFEYFITYCSSALWPKRVREIKSV
jgi:membrane-bound metal-dependent hydrolase YbcI (DUF457 family)